MKQKGDEVADNCAQHYLLQKLARCVCMYVSVEANQVKGLSNDKDKSFVVLRLASQGQ